MSTNIDNNRKAYKAFGEGDVTTLLELIAPDCIWHVGGRSQLAGDYVGHDQILGYFGRLAELTGGTFSARLDDCAELPGSGMIVSLVTTSGTRDGVTLEGRLIELGRSNAQNQLAECWWFSEDQYAGDEFFGPAQVVLPTQQQAPAGQPVKA